MGDPSPASYQPELQSRTIVSHAQGSVQLLLAVSDYTWLYSGIVYPPALGLFKPIARLDNLELLLRAIFLAVAVIGMLLFAYATVATRWRQGLLFLLVGLCFIGYTLPSLLHIITTVQGQYTNAVLLCCLYAMLGLSVLLQCNICGISGRWQQSVAVFFGIGAVIALAMGLAAPLLSLNALLSFSVLSALLKWSAAALLVLISGYGVLQSKPLARVLLWSSLFFASALVFDRIFPLSEPIYGGWFIEIGGLVLVSGQALSLWSNLTKAYRFELTYNEHMRQTSKLLEMQKIHYQQLTERMEEVRIARHDLRHHMRVMQGLATKENLAGLQRYLDDYRPPVGNGPIESYTGHAAADAVLCHYAYLAHNKGIAFDAKVSFPGQLPLPDDALCTLLSNLLENAVEACTLQDSGARTIYLRCDVQEDKLCLVLDNSYTPGTQKIDSQGLGQKSALAIVTQYGGLMAASAQQGLYKVSIRLG